MQMGGKKSFMPTQWLLSPWAVELLFVELDISQNMFMKLSNSDNIFFFTNTTHPHTLCEMNIDE